MTKEQIQEFTLRTSQANHSGLILILTDMVKIYVGDSVKAYDESDRESYGRYMELARRSCNELMSAINPRDEQGKKVLRVLRHIYGCLTLSVIKGEPVRIEESMEMLDKLNVCFEHLHSLDTEGPVMKNTHKVYAGLTYGRGTLNESLGSKDYSNRGFRV